MSEESANTVDVFETIRTTRSMRRLQADPVPNELIRKILEAGVCAPSGGNMQRWPVPDSSPRNRRAFSSGCRPKPRHRPDSHQSVPETAS